MGEKKMQMKLSPVRENLLWKTYYIVCHLSSFGLPFKPASFMKPNYFGTLCGTTLWSAQGSVSTPAMARRCDTYHKEHVSFRWKS